MSHELRTPMNAILGFVELMHSDRKSPLAPHQREWSQHVLSVDEHLMTLLNDLLDLTRIDSGHHPLQPSAVPALRLVQGWQALLGPIALHEGSTLVAPTGDAALRLHADRRALGQVLLKYVLKPASNEEASIAVRAITSRNARTTLASL